MTAAMLTAGQSAARATFGLVLLHGRGAGARDIIGLGEALALPTDRIRPPTEKDLFLFGRTSEGTRTPKKGAAGEVAKQDFGGSYGYVLD